MKKHEDLITGIVLGGLLGLYYPLGEFHTILVIAAVALCLKIVKLGGSH